MLDKQLSATVSITIESSPEQVWYALVNPEKIKQYLFGTDVKTDWKIGSEIRFEGNFNGHQFTDKGYLLEWKEHELLVYRYWSQFSSLPDEEENYSIVSYKINVLSDKKVEFTWHQQGFTSSEAQEHTNRLLPDMLQTIKRISEAN